MPALIDRPSRVAVAVVAVAAVSALAHAAVAAGDLGLRRTTLSPDAPIGITLRVPRTGLAPSAMVAPPHRRPARRPRAEQDRPLDTALGRRRRAARPIAAAFRLAPLPAKPAIVSIYEDRTLRSGDAVMLADGLHVFSGSRDWPHRPRDFVRLQFAASLDWHLRRTLEPLDRNPPTRWTAIMVPPA